MSAFKIITIFAFAFFGLAIAGAYWVQNHMTFEPPIARHVMLDKCFVQNFKRDDAGRAMTQHKLAEICASETIEYRRRLAADGMAKERIVQSVNTVTYGSYQKSLKITPPCPRKKEPKKKEIYQVS
jgi:hypothetical protein